MRSTAAGLTVCSRSQIALPHIVVGSAAVSTRRSSPPTQKVSQQVVDVKLNECRRLVQWFSRRLFCVVTRLVGGHGTEEGRKANRNLWFPVTFYGFASFVFVWLCFFSFCMVVLLILCLVVFLPSLYGCVLPSLYGLWLC